MKGLRELVWRSALARHSSVHRRAELTASSVLRAAMVALRRTNDGAQIESLDSISGLLLPITSALALARSSHRLSQGCSQRIETTANVIVFDPALPPALRRKCANLLCDLVELRTACAATVQGESKLLPVRVPTSILYQMRRHLFPSERMVVGAIRRDTAGWVLESYYDVTGPANYGHVLADADHLTEAFLDMDATGTFFGFWGHSHPGGSVESTRPSGEDCESFEERLAAGDSARLVGAVFAGNYVRFFRPAAGCDDVQLVGSGLRPVNGETEVYEFAA